MVWVLHAQGGHHPVADTDHPASLPGDGGDNLEVGEIFPPGLPAGPHLGWTTVIPNDIRFVKRKKINNMK